MDPASVAAAKAAGASTLEISQNSGPGSVYLSLWLPGPSATSMQFNALTPADNLTSNMKVSMVFSGSGATSPTITSGRAEYPGIAYLGNDEWDLDGNGNANIKATYSPAGGSFTLRAGTKGDPGLEDGEYVTKIHFGTGNDCSEDYYYIRGRDCTAEGLGIAGVRVQTQGTAQKALTEINDAIIIKDNVRAAFGAIQNRLENTASNLQIQAENLQAAESRISDVDVAFEMTAFVRNQILTQAAVSMLSQANSMPQMAVRLLRG